MDDRSNFTINHKQQTMKIFSLGGWIAMSVSLGGIKQSLTYHLNYRACFFKNTEDRDAFYSLSIEEFPNEIFFVGTIDGIPSIQHKR